MISEKYFDTPLKPSSSLPGEATAWTGGIGMSPQTAGRYGYYAGPDTLYRHGTGMKEYGGVYNILGGPQAVSKEDFLAGKKPNFSVGRKLFNNPGGM